MGWFSKKKDEPTAPGKTKDKAFLVQALAALTTGADLDVTKWSDADFDLAHAALAEAGVDRSAGIRGALEVGKINRARGKETVIKLRAGAFLVGEKDFDLL